MFEVIVQDGFAAAHRLREYGGNCERLHGHNWRVEVRLATDRLDAIGMAVDFREVKRHLREVLAEFDHRYLNDLSSFAERNPTTEEIARAVCEALQPRLAEGVKVKAVTAWESPGCGAAYLPD